MSLSLVTYTFDDHAYADDLLRVMGRAGAPWTEALVVDDASAVPYAPAPDITLPVRVLRSERNLGPAHAKNLGLGAAAGQVIFSLDAEIRPHARWLGDSLPLLRSADVGLVGVSPLPARGQSSLSQALHRSRAPERALEEASFVAGGCMLFRREAWNRAGGLAGLSEGQRAFEDVLFCRNMYKAGLRVLRNNRFPVYELRRLRRPGWVRRRVRYYAESVAAVTARHGRERFIVDQAAPLAKALADFRQSRDPILPYILLLETAALYRELDGRGLQGPEPLPGILAALAGRPRSLALFCEDLAAVGYACPPEGARLPEFEAMLRAVEEAGVFEAMEDGWAARWKDEDLSLTYDAHYMDGQGGEAGKGGRP